MSAPELMKIFEMEWQIIQKLSYGVVLLCVWKQAPCPVHEKSVFAFAIHVAAQCAKLSVFLPALFKWLAEFLWELRQQNDCLEMLIKI